MTVRRIPLMLAAILAAPPCTAVAAAPAADETEFRALYKQLVEINTTLSAGNCTQAAEAMRARLLAAGMAKADTQILVPPGRPKDGNLVAVLHGSDAKAKPLLLLAHIDVVEAKREDWTRDPFTLVEEDGWFYGRGVADDKAMAASFTDALVRYLRGGFKPRRDIRLALTCGEETPDTFNGLLWTLQTKPEALSAASALTEGAGGELDEHGKPVALQIQAGEKVYQDFELDAEDVGGHSSRPTASNPIYRLAADLTKLADFRFPVHVTDTVRAYFAARAQQAIMPVIGFQRRFARGLSAGFCCVSEVDRSLQCLEIGAGLEVS